MSKWVAVSGPSKGLSAEDITKARVCLEVWLNPQNERILVCGGAEGIDTLAANVAHQLGTPILLVVPKDLPWNKNLRRLNKTEVIEVPGSYMDRNDKLAEKAEILLAYPKTENEEQRSETWATVRRFRKRRKTIFPYPLRRC